MRRLIASSALIITFVAMSFANVPDVRFASGKSALNIPFKLFNNHIYLHVSVNNARPLWFLLDTGAGNIINRRNASTLGLKLTPAGQTTGIGEGVADLFFTGDVSFNLPGATVRNQKFAVISLENVEECLTKIDVDLQGQITLRAPTANEKEAQSIDGVLGYEFFRLFVVEIDYVAKTINLHDPKNYRYQGDGERIPLEFSGRHILLRALITASTNSSLPGLFMIDSGSALALILHSPFIEQHNLLPPSNQTTPFRVCGIGGYAPTQIGKVSEIRLGNIKLENLVTMFSQARDGVLASSNFSGIIGNAILRRFKVVFDYSRQQMILERVKDRHGRR